MLIIVSILLIVQGLAGLVVIGACRAAAAADRRDPAFLSVAYSPRGQQQPAGVLARAVVLAHAVRLLRLG